MSTKQGQSIYATPNKQTGVQALWDMQISIYKALLAHGRLVNILNVDLNAGSGFNEIANVVGSPRIYLDKGREHNLVHKMHAFFIDNDPDNVVRLEGRVGRSPFYECICQDNSKFLEELPGKCRKLGMRPTLTTGLIYTDPNGPKNGFPVDALIDTFKIFPRLDLAISFSATGQKRIKGKSESYIRIDDVPGIFNKSHWLIRGPVQGDPYQFHILVGRNLQTGDYCRQGFYHWDSEHGKDLRERATLTREELPDYYASKAGQLQLEI